MSTWRAAWKRLTRRFQTLLGRPNRVVRQLDAAALAQLIAAAERQKQMMKHRNELRQRFSDQNRSGFDAEQNATWLLLHQQVLDYALRSLASSPLANHLVLRGSVLMRRWFPASGREPQDIDFVWRPSTERQDPIDGASLTENIVAALCDARDMSSPFSRDRMLVDDITSYGDFCGRRLTFFWQHPELIGGAISIDIALDESLPMAPMPTDIQLVQDQAPIRLLAVDQAVALAWKLYWLEREASARAKDLYDAMILAEARAFDQIITDAVYAYRAQASKPMDSPLPDSFDTRRFIASLFPKPLDWVGFFRPGEHQNHLWKLRLQHGLALGDQSGAIADCSKPSSLVSDEGVGRDREQP